jgi:tetratricopeptide (TPR) repeat protein
MKTAIVVLIGVGLAAITAIMAIQWQNQPQPAEKVAIRATAYAEKLNFSTPLISDEPAEAVASATSPATPALPAPAANKPLTAETLSPVVQTLVSRQTSYAQKLAAWKQLLDTHQLDKAIAELERAAQADPSEAEYPTALGIAYVQQLRALQDFREQSILAIKADQTFDQALELDPTSWEARFWKALSLSYWPEGLNKSSEVIDHFVTLVEQQEKQSPQPQFAETYVRLGEQYQKAGYADYARETWQRGAALFPSDSALREKLATAQ